MKFIVLFIVLCGVNVCYGGLDYKRVHLVDHVVTTSGATNMLFRGNMPTNSTTFAYDELLQYMKLRAVAAGVQWTDNPYMIDISLNNIFDGQDFWNEEKFWKDAPKDMGYFVNWPLGLAGILPPSIYPESVRKVMAEKSVWKFDEVPTRIATIRKLLNSNPAQNRPVVIYVHCTAGCDRTGEVIGSYRMKFENADTTKMYSLDTSECGRSPNYWSTSALEWFCYYMQYTFNESLGDCSGFAKCKLFGKCDPTTTTSSESKETQSDFSSHVSPFVYPKKGESLY